jgi:hypothetical protein
VRRLLLVVGLLACACRSSASTSTTTTTTTATTTATATATASATPTADCSDTPDLDARAAEARTLLRNDAVRTTVVDGTFLYIDADRGRFFDEAVHLATRVLSALRTGRMASHPLCPVSVYVFASRDHFEAHCGKRHYVTDSRNWGLWDPLRREIVVDLSGGRAHVPTTAHELAHVVMAGDFDAPRWFRECVCTLYEAPAFDADGGISGENNWRYIQLRAAVKAGDPHVRLDALFGMNDDVFRGERDDAGSGGASVMLLHEGMARATCEWLDEQGQLWPLYRAWRDSFAADPDGRASFLRVSGRTPAAADADWRGWVTRTK